MCPKDERKRTLEDASIKAQNAVETRGVILFWDKSIGSLQYWMDGLHCLSRCSLD